MNASPTLSNGLDDRSAPAMEHHLFGDYLSENLESVVAAAEKAGGGIFFALATAPAKKRREAAIKWRAEAIQKAVGENPRLAEAVNHLPAAIRKDGYEGNVSLKDFESSAFSALQAAEVARLDRKRAGIQCVREHIHRLQCGGGECRPNWEPADMIVLQSGEISFHSSTTLAKAFGRQSGMAFYHARLDRSSGRFHEMPDSWCAGDELLKLRAGEAGPESCNARNGEEPSFSISKTLPDSGKAPESQSSSVESEKPFPGE